MLKRFLVGLVVAATLMAQAPVPAESASVLDTPGLEKYLRHLLMWPPSVEVTIGNPIPAPIAGYFRVNVRGSLGGKTQEENFFVSADSQTVIRGDIFEVRKNPFEAELALLKTDNQPSLGVPGAPVTVVEFGDFQCPYCKEEASVVRTQLMDAFPGQLQLFYLDYPLDSMHPFARGAAVLGRCIYSQNNASFWAYHDWIFEHQSELSAENLREQGFEYAKTDPKLDIAGLTACAQAPEPRAAVDRTVAMGDALKVSATPTLFINGRRMVGAVELDDLKVVVTHEIAWAKEQKAAADCCSVQLALPGMTPAKATPPVKATPPPVKATPQ